MPHQWVPVFDELERATLDELCRFGVDRATAEHLLAHFPDVAEFDYEGAFRDGTSPAMWALTWQLAECFWDPRFSVKLTFLDADGRECESTIVQNSGVSDRYTLSLTADTSEGSHAVAASVVPQRSAYPGAD